MLLLNGLPLSFGEEGSPAELCEFQEPELKNDYWPVFLEDPLESSSGDFPVIDLIIGKDGKPIGAAPVGKFNDTEREILTFAGKMLEYTPAVACGEVVEGFKRRVLDTYFFVAEEDRDRISVPPVSRLRITSKINFNLQYMAMLITQQDTVIEMVLGKDGKPRDMKAADEVGELVIRQLLEPLGDYLQFVPAQQEGQPVEVGLKLRLRLKGWAGEKTLTGFDLDEIHKPMPRKPGNGSVETGKVFSVQLNFDDRGVMWGLQYLTVMNEAESLAAINAFRNWTIGPGKEEGLLSRSVIVRYIFNEETDSADLLEESENEGLRFPVPLKRPPPEYPRVFRKEGINGYTVLEYTINKKGRVESPKVIFTSAPEFADAAVAAVRKWKFSPATVAGEPTTVRVRVPVTFAFSR